MKADWRIWLVAGVSWAALIAFAVMIVNRIKGGPIFEWLDIVFLAIPGFIMMLITAIATIALVYEILQNTEAMKARRRTALDRKIEEIKKWRNEESLKFKHTMASLGICGDPFDYVLALTKEAKLEWRFSSPKEKNCVTFEADILDDIKVLARQMNVEICYLKPAELIIYYEIRFEDRKNRFDSYIVGLTGSFEDSSPEDDQDPRPKELIEILTKKFGVEIKPQ